MSSQVDPEERESGWTRFVMPAVTALIAVVAAAALLLYIIPSNYYMLLPGQALAVAPMISIKGHPPTHKRGELLMTDVTLYKVDHKIEELYGRLNGDADLEPAEQLSGGLSDKKFVQLNEKLMEDSIRQAEAAAFSVVPGYHVRFAKTGPKVVFLMPGMPADRRFHTGDVIEYVDGHRVTRAAQVSPLIKRAGVGGLVRMRVLRGGKLITVSVRPVGTTNGKRVKGGKTPLIGVYVQDQLVLPAKISIAPGDIGGPSAGLMFTLGIIQRLERQDIAHGCKVAGTGTIDAEGNVGEIGGAKQKVIAAHNAGARYFLVPDVKDNLQPARQYANGLTVIPVKTLRGALEALRHIKPCR